MQDEWTQYNPSNDYRSREGDSSDRSFALWAVGLLIGATFGWTIPTLLLRADSNWIGLGALCGLVFANWIDSVQRRRREQNNLENSIER